MKIQYFKSKGQWFFHLKSRNGKIVAQSEAYKKKASCLKTCSRLIPFGINAYIKPVRVKRKYR